MARTKQAARRRGSKKIKLDNDDTDAIPPSKSRPEQTTCDETIAVRDPALLSDTFAQAIRRHYGDSTSLEQSDLHLGLKVFLDTTSFGERRLAKNLPQYLRTFSNSDEDPSTISPGVPHTLVIASSGIRVADLVRELRVLASPDTTVGKFFAKHMKLKKNIEFAKTTKIGIAVGTPTRLKELIENEAISVTALQRIVIDGSYQNDKKYTIFEMAESFKPMLQMLNLENLKARLADGGDKLQIMVY
jgi:protein CMS1